MSYTKGDWESELYKDGEFEIVVHGAGSSGGTLTLCSRNKHTGRPEEMHSNARLISAAPDLLEQLQESTDILIRIVEAQDWGAIEDQIKDNQQAIAKALGSQS